MGSVIPFRQHRRPNAVAPLIFVEMFEDQLHCTPALPKPFVDRMLSNCRRLLRRARADGWSVGFIAASQRTNHVNGAGFNWIEGFRPRRTDMVFETLSETCYSNSEFSSVMTSAGNCFLLAGFSGERACLATLINAPQHGHHGAMIEDATATWPLPDHGAIESQRAVIALARRYGTILSTDEWLACAGTPRSDLLPCHTAG